MYANHSAPTVFDNALPLRFSSEPPLQTGLKFTGTISNLAPGTYYLRAYVHNLNADSDPMVQAESMSYSEEITFTIAGAPVVKVPGDLNGDGKVDLADAIIGLRILTGMTPVQQVNLGGDVNGDGKIGMQDVLYILQKIGMLR